VTGPGRILRRGALLLLALHAVQCSGRPGKIVIGVALNEYDHAAVEMAVDEINRDGGIDGVPLELAGLDWDVRNHTDPEESFDWVEQFDVVENVVAVVGHSDSAATLASAPLYNQRGIPQIVTIASHPAINDIGECVYRICVRDELQGEALAKFAVQEQGWRRLAMFYENDAYGKGLAGTFLLHAEEGGADIVSSVFHPHSLTEVDRRTITSVLERLREEDPPDAFVLFQRVGAGTFTINEIRRLGFDSAILGSEHVADWASRAGRPAEMEGVFASSFFDPLPGDEAAVAFIERYRAAFGGDPGYSKAFAYDAIYLLRDAILHGGASRRGVKRYLDRVISDRITVEGVTGAYVLDETRDARREFYIGQIRDGSFRRLKTIVPPD
jgi:branched-chain amino acid transport system substrate-binding protein